MTISTFANFTRRANQNKVDITRREKTGIKIPVYIPTLAVAEEKIYSMESDEIRALRNFPAGNQITITNSSDQPVKLRLNYSDTSSYLLPAGSLLTIDNIEYQAFSVTNMGDAEITENTVLVHVVWQPDSTVNIVGGAV